jgi:hypothetical protein
VNGSSESKTVRSPIDQATLRLASGLVGKLLGIRAQQVARRLTYVRRALLVEALNAPRRLRKPSAVPLDACFFWYQLKSDPCPDDPEGNTTDSLDISHDVDCRRSGSSCLRLGSVSRAAEAREAKRQVSS